MSALERRDREGEYRFKRSEKNKQERVVDGVETEAGIFVRNMSFDG